MFFKNLRLYRLTKPFELSAEELDEKLSPGAFRPCGSLELSSYGWVPPLGRHGIQLTHATNGDIMVCARKEEKVLPASVVRERVAEKVTEIEEAEMRTLKRKERDQIKDEILQELIPRAFTRSSVTYAYISPRTGQILVDSSGAKKAEELLSALRNALGTLPVIPMATKQSPAVVMSGWVSRDIDSGEFALGTECELHEAGEEGGVVRCRKQDLAADEIQSHLEAGKKVEKLALTWAERVSCVLADDLSIRRLRFEDVVLEELGDAEDDAAAFDADFAIMASELSRFIGGLTLAFGGEAEITDSGLR